MKIISIGSQLANGKNVLADYLVKQLNRDSLESWECAAFANAVKDIFASSFGVDREFIEKWKRNPEPPPGFLKNIRQSLQFIGDGFRQIMQNIWIEIALRDENKKLCCTDMRYHNEARAVKKKGGTTILLYRPGFLNDDPNPSESQIKPAIQWCINTNQKDGLINFDVPYYSYKEADTTEEIMINYDIFVVNDGTLEDLYNKVDNILVPIINEKFNQ